MVWIALQRNREKNLDICTNQHWKLQRHGKHAKPIMLVSDYREMNKSDKEKQNESLPPNISWPDVLEGKLTPSEDTTGKWVASTTIFERKGLRFGMESSPASAEVKGSGQAEERETETKKKTERKKKKEWRGRGGHQSQQQEKESMQSPETQMFGWRCRRRRRRRLFTCPRCRHWKPRGTRLESWLQVKEVALHLHCTADGKEDNERCFYTVTSNSFLFMSLQTNKNKI